MNETKSYLCKVCGLMARFREPLRHAHYKGNPPNCPSCHRPMEAYEEKDEAPAASRA